MIRILGLMTCYNRKEKTLNALNHLIKGNPEVAFSFVVADDGSTDGTFEALQKIPNLMIVRGDGNLFYSGGMRLAIAEAKKLGFKHAIGPATVRDKFVIPMKDLRETLIKYVK